MPRNGSGSYSLPEPPFVAGTVISSAAVNSDFSDIATALTASLPRDGQAGMTGQFKAVDGALGTPSISFNNEPTTGFYKPSAGRVNVSLLGATVNAFTAAGLIGPVQGSVPIGFVGDYCGAAAPSQWLLCYGQNVSRTTYANLFSVLSTTFGAGDGFSTFGIPDYRSRVGIGKDDMGGAASNRIQIGQFGTNPSILGNVGGFSTQTVTLAQLPIGINSSNASVSISVSAPNVVTGGSPIASGALGAQIFGFNTIPSITTLVSSGNNAVSVTSNNTSGQPLPVVQPGIIVNKIIYAGV